MTPIKPSSANLKLATDLRLLDHNSAVVLLDDQHTVLQINELGRRWLGDMIIGETQLNDTWLSMQGLHLSDRRFQSTSLNALFNQQLRDRYLGIALKKQTIWVQWHLTKFTDKQGATQALILTDVTNLMQELQALKQRTDEADTRDYSTKLYNRRYAMERLEQLHLYAKRYNSLFSIAIIDIDHFKRVNDTYGQQFGDEILEKLASVIRRSVRETDFCARFGGEEFLILMPETNSQDAMMSLDRLRQQVSELKWSEMQSHLTISIGVVAWQPNRSVEQLLFLVDQRLMTAKQAGRNQVCGDLT